MKITSKIKGTLKESYRSIKKSIKTMLTKLGLNKSQVQEATARTLNAVEVEITQFLNEEMQKVDLLSTPNPSIKGLAEPLKPQVDLLSTPNPSIKGLAEPLKPQVNKTYGNGQTEANKYKEMLTKLNSFLANEKQLSSKTVAKAPVPLPRTKFNHNLTTETKDDESYGR
ncbi:hypothetical protein GL982_03940 [Spiroplasma citri]|uniref:Uncharacterized protein n=1 Tax=Spiroplasma citri TaxID=2133 RepID=A0AAJ4EJA2_SPICI|nr:hypothetical protein [Spiroplasma citri]APE74818.1 hypothetical protein SCITRI_00929 [Spiroplasma citri]QED24742.1 hypothetical protein FRX96_04740 [Spiroplasma citri]QIA68927.1 hypothetical protein GL298_05040 [Spiroplasma citri]QIA70789.1 hypothetical protein GL981_05060 [Spiroplasma citri]QIA72848.1 hypothetical protein GL982_03940 [Spiroplasma citri]